MDHGGPFTPEGQPDDPDEDASPRGWIPPEDRLWRHPSEMGKHVPAVRAPRRDRRAAAVAGLGAVAAVAVATTLVLAASTGGPAPRPVTAAARTTAIDGGATPADSVLPAPDMAGMAGRLDASLVALRSATAPHGTLGTGVVLPGPGDLVLTAATAVAGDGAVQVVTGGGRRVTGQVVGSDDHAGVAVVRLGTDLQAAEFADETLSPDEVMMTACVCGGSGADHPALAVARVTTVGAGGTVAGGAQLMDAIEATTLTPLQGGAAGGVLVDTDGRVLGILEGELADGTAAVGVFVPAPLALGVAEELASGRPAAHGWLGVAAADADGGRCGAEVVAVAAGSPAQAVGLTGGDVIDGVDGHRVCSLADLEARLYVTPPGRAVALDVQTASGSDTVTAVLDAAGAAGTG